MVREQSLLIKKSTNKTWFFKNCVENLYSFQNDVVLQRSYFSFKVLNNRSTYSMNMLENMFITIMVVFENCTVNDVKYVTFQYAFEQNLLPK